MSRTITTIHMTGPEHYGEAERLLTLAQQQHKAPEAISAFAALALAHATLAGVAATVDAANGTRQAYEDRDTGRDVYTAEPDNATAWKEALG